MLRGPAVPAKVVFRRKRVPIFLLNDFLWSLRRAGENLFPLVLGTLLLSTETPDLPAQPPSRVLRIATRESPLAMWQAQQVAAWLADHGQSTTLVPLASGGDTDMRPIDGTRQVGVFTKRIQQAVLSGEADVAVHSLKDLPTETDPRLALAAVPTRERVNDCLVSPTAMTLDGLPRGATIGTGSRRRAAQLLNRRPDLIIQPIRGNVQTRLAKLAEGQYDAIVLAQAGLVRLELTQQPRVELTLEEMLPAVGQGALGIEVRRDDEAALAALKQIDDPAARAAVTAERRLLAALHGGCLAPIAAFAQIHDQRLSLRALVLSQDGQTRLEQNRQTTLGTDDWESSAIAIAKLASDALIADGARQLVEDAR